jgi:hypothetical protein
MSDLDPTDGVGATRAREDDRHWFASYTPRNFRMRDPYPFEFGEQFPPDGMLRLVIVRRARNGEHMRAWIRVPKDAPLPNNEDAALEKTFNQATLYDDAPRS